jgi:hypothetical protein
MDLFRKRSDRELAETKYADRESASDRASRQRRQSHRTRGAQRAAQQGQAWEDRDRQRRGTSFWTW